MELWLNNFNLGEIWLKFILLEIWCVTFAELFEWDLADIADHSNNRRHYVDYQVMLLA